MVMKLVLLAFAAAMLWSSVVSAQSPDFAYYNLSLIWPASFCISAPKNCVRPIPKIFTISNGLCPTLKNGTALPPYDPVDNNCNYSPAAPGDMAKALKPIQRRLQKTWPSLSNGASNQLFWEVVWANQGMCSDYPQDPLAYFTSALNLAENSKYDPLKVLGVQPSSTTAYAISTLLANVKKKVGFYPQISCSISSNKLYLREVRFCFKRAKPPTQLQDCPTTMDYVCNSVPTAQQKVIFPPATATISGHVSWDLLASA
ncbi:RIBONUCLEASE 1, ribonuclease 1 [Hibiscus trionum]|uniref:RIBONUCLEASE 1, ribonuclease 1 n=1 Tax=Hibiscus trionum TaxID=183268 RepID=A0A9W7JIJ4_HIBTR|nr:RIBONUCLEASE 1, ribonuclease 1 [Hibiscus trionum]